MDAGSERCLGGSGDPRWPKDPGRSKQDGSLVDAKALHDGSSYGSRSSTKAVFIAMKPLYCA
jgi:hypothetical protein